MPGVLRDKFELGNFDVGHSQSPVFLHFQMQSWAEMFRFLKCYSDFPYFLQLKTPTLWAWKGIATHSTHSPPPTSPSGYPSSGSRSTCCCVFFKVDLLQTAQATPPKRPGSHLPVGQNILPVSVYPPRDKEGRRKQRRGTHAPISGTFLQP